ncbi:MAG: VWA domain-containing protein [Crenarchaeota archaeon]|nr:MAG: VWA domain-containing protein [Thermoproteota archaeon]RDJ33558.1 MAG: VWA domain-containing protein [Thermoproteota archaeon]RDJ38120.1 MAG: VWA domain-containing protein [Thermoproteota archaeon]RDJ39111.1 MAG: VWA domain-containing protein [Thermoproteota archaeon]
MAHHDYKNLVYFANKTKKESSKDNNRLSEENLEKILESLAKQAMREKPPTMEELESILQESTGSSKGNDKENQSNSQNLEEEQGSASITKLLQNEGYLRNDTQWLTNKAFFQIGNKILQDVMKDLSSAEFGLHETNVSGSGNVVIDSTKKFEPGDEIKQLSVPQTLLNSIQRILKTQEIKFPISIEPDDLEEYETLEDVKTSVVYCIDLSSTMKQSLGSNVSRLVAAKKALWSLYVLNKKFFPSDSVFVVGFASMASIVNPFDIPFLKTFDANDNFLHYTNYQAALRLARKILQKNYSQNKRIVLITDGQPSACFIENEYQKNEIISEKPYSNFYSPDPAILSKVQKEKKMRIENNPDRLVYLCYRYKKVDPKIDKRTMIEAKKCLREGIQIDSIVVSDEFELLDYVKELEKELKGKTYHIDNSNMDKVLVTDYLTNTKKVLNVLKHW